MKTSPYPYTIGLTGSIASGKSTAALFFEREGIEVISADKIAHDLTEANTPALAAIAAHFGQTILTKTNTLNRAALRQVMLKHPDERRWLEAYLHPQIRKTIETTLHQVKSPYAVVEIPLLTRREDFPYLSEVLLLEIDAELQIQRLMSRDQCSREEATRMVSIQPCQTLRRGLADDILQNDGHTEHLNTLLHALHTRYLTKSQVA